MSAKLRTRTKPKASASTGIIVSVQSGGQKETYLRAVCKTIDEVEETVHAMLADQAAYTIGKVKRKSTFPGHRPKKTAPALKPEEEVIPGVEVDATVERALT